jgi:hypothetical protein
MNAAKKARWTNTTKITKNWIREAYKWRTGPDQWALLCELFIVAEPVFKQANLPEPKYYPGYIHFDKAKDIRDAQKSLLEDLLPQTRYQYSTATRLYKVEKYNRRTKNSVKLLDEGKAVPKVPVLQ